MPAPSRAQREGPMLKAKDRWERMLDKLPKVYDSEDFHEEIPVYDREQVLNLLRQQHRAVVRQVKWFRLANPSGSWEEGFNVAINNVLERLAKRAT